MQDIVPCLAAELRLTEGEVQVELHEAAEAKAGVQTEQRLLHDLQTQGVVPDPDTLLILPQVSVHCPGVDKPDTSSSSSGVGNESNVFFGSYSHVNISVYLNLPQA